MQQLAEILVGRGAQVSGLFLIDPDDHAVRDAAILIGRAFGRERGRGLCAVVAPVVRDGHGVPVRPDLAVARRRRGHVAGALRRVVRIVRILLIAPGLRLVRAAAQTRLYACELRRVLDRIAHIADQLRLLLDALVAIGRVRVVAQKLRPARAALLLDGAKHVREVNRIVAGARHDLRTEHVGLRLILATELQKIDADRGLRALPEDRAGRAADDRASDCADAGEDRILLRFGGLRRAVAQGDVR